MDLVDETYDALSFTHYTRSAVLFHELTLQRKSQGLPPPIIGRMFTALKWLENNTYVHRQQAMLTDEELKARHGRGDFEFRKLADGYRRWQDRQEGIEYLLPEESSS